MIDPLSAIAVALAAGAAAVMNETISIATKDIYIAAKSRLMSMLTLDKDKNDVEQLDDLTGINLDIKLEENAALLKRIISPQIAQDQVLLTQANQILDDNVIKAAASEQKNLLVNHGIMKGTVIGNSGTINISFND